MITEATIAYSDRSGFAVAKWMSPLLKPGIRRTARKLWVDDLEGGTAHVSFADAADDGRENPHGGDQQELERRER